MSKDLDFDELDKAVSSLMGGVKDQDNLPKSNTLDINETLAPDEDPSYDTLGHTAETIGSEAIDKHEQTVSIDDDKKTDKEEPESSDDASESEPEKEEELESEEEPAPASIVTPQPSPKRGGRFMDVVHPSSDMKTAGKPSPAQPVKVSHEGTTIQAPAVETDSVTETMDGDLPLSSEAADEPDEEEAPTGEATSSAEPLTSPFLPDAKVEKRPLGGDTKSPLEKKPADDEPDDDEPSKKDDEFSKMDAMNEPAQSLSEVTEHVPEEFQDELVAVEKNIEEIELKKDEPEEDEAKDDEKPVKTKDSHQSAVISIAKQYQEKPSSGEKTNGSIYDTENYHKPLAHPAEQKSGWLWVVVIIVLILVGGGLGAAAYFFGLI